MPPTACMAWLFGMQVVALLHEMGLDSHDTHPIKKAGLSGAELLLLDECQLMEVLGLPKHKARRLKRLQVGRQAQRQAGFVFAGRVLVFCSAQTNMWAVQPVHVLPGQVVCRSS